MKAAERAILVKRIETLEKATEAALAHNAALQEWVSCHAAVLQNLNGAVAHLYEVNGVEMERVYIN